MERFFAEFFGQIFMENCFGGFFGRIFWEDFLGGFFWRIFGSKNYFIIEGIDCLSRIWFLSRFCLKAQGRKEENFNP